MKKKQFYQFTGIWKIIATIIIAIMVIMIVVIIILKIAVV